jgi:uncharacterized peroxidase-related enzyme
VRAHSEDLRVEVRDDALVAAVVADYRTAPIDQRTKGLLAYAEKLTHTPDQVCADDVKCLRQLGWEDRAILDTVQVIAYFNSINRIAQGLGISPEPERQQG